MKFNSLILCETCLVDARTNNISFINIIEEIGLFGIPSVIPRATAVVQVEKDSEEEADTFSMELVADINGKEILRQPINANFTGKLRTRVLLDINGFPLKEAGILKFSIIYDKKNVLESCININLPSPQVKVQQP